MEMQRLRELLDRFDRVRVLVVGDVYLDENVSGVVTGISLEAPIPIYEVHERRHNPGAAGNAACNVASLGGQTYMVGVVGDDINAEVVRRAFADRNVDTSGLVVDPARPTNTYGKLRAGGHNIPTQEVLRTDTPAPTLIDGAVEEAVIANIQSRAKDIDAIVVVDQVASVVTERVLEAVVAVAKEHGLLTVGDSRSRASAFKGFDVIVPNDREAGLGAGIEVLDDATLREAGQALLSGCRSALVTCGPRGITIFSRDQSPENVPILPCTVVDVTGAGDTVTAAVALTLASAGALREAAFVGNAAAGVAVGQEMVVTVTRDEVVRAARGETRPAKLRSLAQLAGIVQSAQEEGKTVVWTNGCFDILHAGHITYLIRAARLGDLLVVGLNSDASVRENKGPNRPVVNEADRALVLSALECVDFLTIFGEKTTEPLLEALKPDVYAKGGDYTVDTINQDERQAGRGGTVGGSPSFPAWTASPPRPSSTGSPRTQPDPRTRRSALPGHRVWRAGP